MKHLFTIMIMALSLLWGFSVYSNAQTCSMGTGCSAGYVNWCCPPEGCTGIPSSFWGQARCNSNPSFMPPAGACCLDGSFSPGDRCSCNQPPDCTNAEAAPDYSWPPNHKFDEIWVLGVTDPDGDAVIITIDTIFQDEPVASSTDVGAGNFCPDGMGVGESYAHVRSERSGSKKVPGDGRVYHIGFTADDGRGGACSGTVMVCVPHDKKDSCVDGGALYDSTDTCN